MTPRLTGRTAIVTGASSGIGRAVALALAKEGAHVLAGARSLDKLEALAKEARGMQGNDDGSIRAHALDVRDLESVKAFAAKASELGLVDIVFNNAGIGTYGAITDMTVDDWDNVIATNLRGPFLIAKYTVPLMLPRADRAPGLVVNVASVAGKSGIANLSAYCASKHGVRGLSESIALELAPENIRVVALNPGYVATDMTAGGGMPAEDMIQPEAVAEAIIQLATMHPSMMMDDVTIWPLRMYAD